MSDLDGKCFIRRGVTLVPADINAEEWLCEIKDGAEVILSGRRPRSPQSRSQIGARCPTHRPLNKEPS